MIPDVEPVKNHYGNNVATEFDFDFYIEDETQLEVTHTDYDGVENVLTYGVDYTIHEFGNETGSYITFPIQGSSYGVLGWYPSTDEKEMLSIALTLPFSQEAEYEMSKDLNKKNLEKSFDKLTRITQILRRGVMRAIKVAESSSETPEELLESIMQTQKAAQRYAEIAQNSAGTAEKAAEAAENMADRNLSNLTNTGKSQYNPFCINTGVTDEDGNPACLVLDGDTLATQGVFTCSTADGTIYEISDALALDVSGYGDGDYNVFIDPVEKTLSLLNNTIHVGNTFPSGAVTGDYLLNTSKVPYSLDQLTDSGIVTGLNAVWAGILAGGGGG